VTVKQSPPLAVSDIKRKSRNYGDKKKSHLLVNDIKEMASSSLTA